MFGENWVCSAVKSGVMCSRLLYVCAIMPCPCTRVLFICMYCWILHKTIFTHGWRGRTEGKLTRKPMPHVLVAEYTWQTLCQSSPVLPWSVEKSRDLCMIRITIRRGPLHPALIKTRWSPPRAHPRPSSPPSHTPHCRSREQCHRSCPPGRAPAPRGESRGRARTC